MIDLLASTGMRVGELVKLNREDINSTSVSVSFSVKVTRNVSCISMLVQRFIYSNISQSGKTETKHCSYLLPNHTIDYKYQGLRQD